MSLMPEIPLHIDAPYSLGEETAYCLKQDN